MNSMGVERHLGNTAAIGLLAVWAIAFAGIGVNHLANRQSDSRSLFLVAGVIAAFLGSLWLLSSQPRSSAVVALSLVLFGALVLSAVLVSRNPTLLTLRWSAADGRNSMLFVSWVWVAIFSISIVGAGVVAEFHHVVHSRAR